MKSNDVFMSKLENAKKHINSRIPKHQSRVQRRNPYPLSVSPNYSITFNIKNKKQQNKFCYNSCPLIENNNNTTNSNNLLLGRYLQIIDQKEMKERSIKLSKINWLMEYSRKANNPDVCELGDNIINKKNFISCKFDNNKKLVCDNNNNNNSINDSSFIKKVKDIGKEIAFNLNYKNISNIVTNLKCNAIDTSSQWFMSAWFPPAQK